MQHPFMTTVPEDGGRLHNLIKAVESRVHLLSVYTNERVGEISPLPFEWTVLLVVFTFLTMRQLVLWYTCDLKPHTKGYVYWHTSDLINVEYRESYKREHHLSSALIVYITQKLWRDKPLTAAELKNKVFTLHLLSLYAKSVDDALEEWSSEENFDFRNHEELLLPVKLPIYPSWTPVHEGSVEICTWISTTRIKNFYPEAHRYFYLRARKDNTGTGGAEADVELRRFVDNAVAFYFANGYGDRDERSLRMYRVSPSRNGILVKASLMPLAPTFDTLFFPQRTAVLMQLQRFMEMKGRYAIKGFPHKLGFLLYGPRGTGKRSFLRALAHHTKRHIVRVPLSAFTKNQQLFNTFLFEEAMEGSTDDWAMLSNKKVIFLLEDVDTTSEVVRARDSLHAVRVRRSRGLTTRGSHEVKDAFDHIENFIDVIQKTNNKDREDEVRTTATSHATSHTPRAQGSAKRLKAPKADASVDASLVRLSGQLGWGGILFSSEGTRLDAINLSSLLNVLDGAIENPERIVVMITDHPERLDPALLRPGRLATHIRFDYMELEELIGLCGLFYGSECLFVKGTLLNDGATMPLKTRSSVYEYASAITDGNGAPRFPHEMEDNTVKSQPPKEAQMNVADDLLSWKRHEFELVDTEKSDEKVIRQLSSAQAAQVRACVAALEQENAPQSHTADRGYNFFVTPAHVHYLCMRSKTLDLFLTSLAAYIRRETREV